MKRISEEEFINDIFNIINENKVENFQVLGFEKGQSKEEALSKLLENSSWIKDNSYNVDEIIGCQVIR